MPVLPKAIYREILCNDYKSSYDILNRIQEKNPKIHIEVQRPPKNQSSLG